MQGTDQIDNKALQILQEWERQEDQLPGFFRYYSELLHIQSDAQSAVTIEKPILSRNLARERLLGGKALLSFSDFSVDWRQVQAIFEQVVIWSDKDSPGLPEETKKLLEIGSDIASLRKLAEAWYTGCSLADVVIKVAVDHKLLDSMLAITLKPFLAAYSKSLLPLVDQELWKRRYCPICGGKPDFACLDKEHGARWLICSRCDAEWLYLRLECPCCGTQNQDSLTYFTADHASNPYRMYVCDQCHCYIKAIDLRLTDNELFWPVERIKTLSLDVQAQDKGYKPG
jgi:FdhE protein